MAQKIKPIPISIQALNIKRLFPDTKIVTVHDQQLSWTHTITPSPLGDLYKIKIVYHLTKSPKIFVIDPKPLLLAQGKTSLPHCYDQKQQQLCLYYPKSNEWDKTMLLSTTVIPWTFDWLYHYEIWLGTGDWNGGGIHNINETVKKANDASQQ